MKHNRRLTLLFVLASIAALSLLAKGDHDNYSIGWHTIDGGGGVLSGSGYILIGTIGQPDVGDMTGSGGYSVRGGFWPAVGPPAETTLSDCPVDLTGDGEVGVPDLLMMLQCWGPVVHGCFVADLTGDSVVGVPDLIVLLAAWGGCP